MLDVWVLRIEERLVRHRFLYHKKWYDVKYGLGVLKKGIVINDDLHEKRCS
jgi:hypothetical protein